MDPLLTLMYHSIGLVAVWLIVRPVLRGTTPWEAMGCAVVGAAILLVLVAYMPTDPVPFWFTGY